MPEWQETVEDIRAEDASVQRLFGGDGTRVRDRSRGPRYVERLAEAATFINEVVEGRRPFHHLREAMSTSDFPTLFSDILDRQLLGAYREVPAVWPNYVRRATVPDFRPVLRRAVDGLEGRLDTVAELEEYPEGRLEVQQDTYRVRKYGRRIDLSWETMVNDDLDSFRNLPDRLARGARRTEQFQAASLYVGGTGPRSDLYTAPNGNIITGNPALSLNSLQAALQQLATFTDVDDEPIVIDMAHLVVPPALEIVAQNIVNASLLRLDITNGQMEVNNWMQNRLKIWVDPYIPVIANSNKNTSWWLFADPNTGRSFGELGFLRGNETPALFQRDPDSRRVGGGGEDAVSFDDDSAAWKVRHVVGGGLLANSGGAKATVASNGSGA